MIKLAYVTFFLGGTLDGGMKKIMLVPWTRCKGSFVLPTPCVQLPNSLERDVHHIFLLGLCINLSRLCFAPMDKWYTWLAVFLVYGPWFSMLFFFSV